MFDKFSREAIEVLYLAHGYSRSFKSEKMTTEHLLAALALEQKHLPGRAFANMNVSSRDLLAELERGLLSGKEKEIAPLRQELREPALEELKFSFPAKLALKRAGEMRIFFGHRLLEPEHILLALIDLRDEGVMKMLEELGANFIYLNRLVSSLIAERDALAADTMSLRKTVVQGLDELVYERINVLEDIERLAASTDIRLADLPQKSEIAHLVFSSYMPDFLFVQVGHQRAMLEEILKLLRKRAGNLDPEFLASTVSSTAQNLRSELRHTIEYIWSHEFRLMSKLPDEADYDLIGSVIEDLWWTHSEEIALNEVFDEALDDHRRKQMLNLQKRRLEISERFGKLRNRLKETIKQCFLKRVSA